MVNENKNKLIRDSVQWDVVNWSKAIFFWEKQLNNRKSRINALELGCGENGGLSLWLASKGYNVICSGYDCDLDFSKKIHKNHKFEGEIEYRVINANSISEIEYYDIICFKSVLGGIMREKFETGETVIQQIYKALKPGGILLFAENLKASKLHKLLRKKYGALKNNWYYFSLDDIVKLLQPFFTVQYQTFGFVGCLGRTETQRKLLGYFDTLVFDKILTKDLHYIVAVIAEKKS